MPYRRACSHENPNVPPSMYSHLSDTLRRVPPLWRSFRLEIEEHFEELSSRSGHIFAYVFRATTGDRLPYRIRHNRPSEIYAGVNLGYFVGSRFQNCRARCVHARPVCKPVCVCVVEKVTRPPLPRTGLWRKARSSSVSSQSRG